MPPSITIYNDDIFNFIRKDSEIKTLASDCAFTEGPVWNEKGFYLFSDITANCIYKIEEGKKKEIYLNNSGICKLEDAETKEDQAGSNGLAWHKDDLLICRHGSHDIARHDGKVVKPFVSEYEGKPFNSPNDLILHSNGKLYFSDPPYGLKEGKLNPEKFQPLAGVYCLNDGRLQLVCNKYEYPNGVCLSPDQSVLYICSNKPFEKFISCYNTKTDRFMDFFAEENSDGIECDRKGNIYLCNKEGIIILDKNGERLALLKLPTVAANICWGGKDFNDLLITARENVFLIKDLQR